MANIEKYIGTFRFGLGGGWQTWAPPYHALAAAYRRRGQIVGGVSAANRRRDQILGSDPAIP